MGGTESSTGKVVRNGDWEHRICWAESKPSTHSDACGIQERHGSHISSRYTNLTKSCSESKSLNQVHKDIPQNNLNNRTFSLDQDEIKHRFTIEDKDDSDYWSTPSSSMRYYRTSEVEDDSQIIPGDENTFQRTSSAQKFRRSFQKYTGTVIRSPLDRINGVNPPRRLLRNNFVDGYDRHAETCNTTLDMIELSPIQDETKSVDTCSTSTSVSIKDTSYGVLI